MATVPVKMWRDVLGLSSTLDQYDDNSDLGSNSDFDSGSDNDDIDNGVVGDEVDIISDGVAAATVGGRQSGRQSGRARDIEDINGFQNQLSGRVQFETFKTLVLSVTRDRAADAFDVVNRLPELEIRPSYKMGLDNTYYEIIEFWALVDDEVVSTANASFSVLEPSSRILRITKAGIIIEDVAGSYDTWDRVHCNECCLQLSHLDFELLNSLTLLDSQDNEIDYFVTEAGQVYLPILYRDQYLRRLHAKLKSGSQSPSQSTTTTTAGRPKVG